MNDIRTQPVILLTACISPGGMAFTALQDVNAREKQYKDALHYYLSETSVPILFIENTNHDLSPFFEDEIQRGRLEMITFDGNNYDKSRGKGYGEAMLIQYGLTHSEFLKKYYTIIKITGRLKCHGVHKVIKYCKKDNAVYSAFTRDGYGNEISNSQLFVFNKNFWENSFYPRINMMNDSKGLFFEHILYSAIQNWISEGNYFSNFWFPLEVEGVSGSFGNKISQTKTSKIVLYLHTLLHYLGYNGPLKFWRSK